MQEQKEIEPAWKKKQIRERRDEDKKKKTPNKARGKEKKISFARTHEVMLGGAGKIKEKVRACNSQRGGSSVMRGSRRKE